MLMLKNLGCTRLPVSAAYMPIENEHILVQCKYIKKNICVLLSINMFHGAEDDPNYQPPRWCLVETFRSSSLLESLPRTLLPTLTRQISNRSFKTSPIFFLMIYYHQYYLLTIIYNYK